VIKLNDWQLGMIESTCVIISIGISVDYVVHICHEYVNSDKPNKLKDSIDKMCSTIIGGAITTSISAIFLILCNSYALNKFGILLMTTILSSVVSSLIFLPALILIVWPHK
jgi:predicted RND superfamily exporter protein